jgi:hypothetical protein
LVQDGLAPGLLEDSFVGLVDEVDFAEGLEGGGSAEILVELIDCLVELTKVLVESLEGLVELTTTVLVELTGGFVESVEGLTESPEFIELTKALAELLLATPLEDK